MVKDFLRQNSKIKFVLLAIRIYLGVVWFLHGSGKISDKNFDATTFLKDAIAKADGADAAVQGWWAAIIKYFLLPNVEVLNYLIPLGELFVGLGLLGGLFTRQAIYFGLIMNFSYLLSGSLDVNPQIILLSMLLLVSKDNASRIGIDGILVRTMKKRPPAAPVKPPM